uniref:Uncharacterized protein n=1 Tax=Ananas comosus var. bracteatus TaxID=296719 RepID=A0A6V7NTL9_ANACO|nr:unnamed protein product [Ananas comosus var. bracteatus]
MYHICCCSFVNLASSRPSGKVVVIDDRTHWELLFSSSHTLWWFIFFRGRILAVDRGEGDRVVVSISYPYGFTVEGHQIECYFCTTCLYWRGSGLFSYIFFGHDAFNHACLPLCLFAQACEGRSLQAGTPELAFTSPYSPVRDWAPKWIAVGEAHS